VVEGAAHGAREEGIHTSIIIRDGTNSNQLATVDVNGDLHVLDDGLALATGTPGSAVPASAMQVAGSDGTDLRTVLTDPSGRVVTLANGPRSAIGTVSVQNTSATPATFIAAGATGKYQDIISLVFSNETASATVMSLSDGTKTYKFALASSGGLTVNFPSTLPATSTATAWTLSNSAADTVDCVAVYVTN
jgi:5-hydroxyisourate hydrolase-like protein (transthyretin family)